MIRVLVFSIVVGIVPRSLVAQSKLGNWQAYFLSAHVNDSPWRFVFDAQHRDHGWFGDLDHIIIRPGIQYFHTPTNTSYLVGYSFFIFQNEGDTNTTELENRIFQDVDLRHRAGRVSIRHRYRAEERFVQNAPFSFRLRYAIFIDVPLNNDRIEAKTWYLPIWNEVFINTSAVRFDRNWLFGGLGYQITDGLGVRLGAMKQFQKAGDKMQVLLSLHHNMIFK